MAKIFEFNKGQSGTLIDSVSKTAGTLTAGSGGFRKTEKGMAMKFDGGATYIDTGVLNSTTVMSVSAWIKRTNLGSTDVILSNRDSNNDGMILFIKSSNNVEFRINADAVTSSTTILNNVWYHILATFDGSTIKLYMNGTLDDSTSSSETISVNSNYFIGREFYTSALFFHGYIGNVLINDTALTQTEINNLYKQFLNSYDTEKPVRNFEYPRPTNYIEEGKVAHYVFSPETVSNGTLIDVSQSGHNGTINGALLSNDGMKFDGVDDYVDLGDLDILDGLTTATWNLKFKTTESRSNKYLFAQSFNGQTFSITTSNGKLTGRVTGSTQIISAQDYDDGLEHTVSMVLNGSSLILYVDGLEIGSVDDASTLTQSSDDHIMIGARGDNGAVQDFGAHEILDAQIYNYAFTPQQVKNYHNSFIKPILIEDFSNEGADGVVKTPKGFVAGTGAGKIQEITTYVSKDLDIGKKYFEFTTSGTIIIPINLDDYPNNGYISYDYYDGASWATRLGLVDAPVTGAAYSNGYLTFTGSNIGDRMTNIEVKNGVKQ